MKKKMMVIWVVLTTLLFPSFGAAQWIYGAEKNGINYYYDNSTIESQKNSIGENIIRAWIMSQDSKHSQEMYVGYNCHLKESIIYRITANGQTTNFVIKWNPIVPDSPNEKIFYQLIAEIVTSVN